MLLNVTEGLEQGVAQAIGRLKIPVVGRVLAGVIPNPLRRVKFRPVARQREDLHITAILGKPVIRFPLLVIGGVVLNEKDAVAAAIKRGDHLLLQERHIGFPMKIVLLVLIKKARVVQPHRPKNLLRVPLAPGGNLRLAAQACPGRVQGRRLAEGSLVLEYNHRPFRPGFFLRRG